MDKTQKLMRNECGPPENPPWGPDAPDPREERDRWRGLMEGRIASYQDPTDCPTLYDCGEIGFAVADYERPNPESRCVDLVVRWFDAEAVVRFPR